MIKKSFVVMLINLCLLSLSSFGQELYKKTTNTNTRWASFENLNAEKGLGGKENQQAKGHPAQNIEVGEKVTLMQVSGAGIINRIWMTINKRTPETLRGIRIDMYWDGEEKPAVSAPLGDFFGIGLGKLTAFETELFSNPEGRSFNCNIPMPFRKGAKMVLTNESKTRITLFYDIDFLRKDHLEKDALYFHAFWNRQLKTKLGEDFEILPKIKGVGRFLGVNMGVKTDESYRDSWWGEGEVKIYIDEDKEYPTLVGTGTEDYIGTAWGQGVFNHRHQGSLVADVESGNFAFYRYHIPDPVYFNKDIKVTIQQIGGCQKDRLLKIVEEGAKIIPVSVAGSGDLIKLLEQSPSLKITDPKFPDGWVNFYRQDDVSSMAYFYLDRPSNDLPDLAPVEIRTKNLNKTKPNDIKPF